MKGLAILKMFKMSSVFHCHCCNGESHRKKRRAPLPMHHRKHFFKVLLRKWSRTTSLFIMETTWQMLSAVSSVLFCPFFRQFAVGICISSAFCISLLSYHFSAPLFVEELRIFLDGDFLLHRNHIISQPTNLSSLNCTVIDVHCTCRTQGHLPSYSAKTVLNCSRDQAAPITWLRFSDHVIHKITLCICLCKYMYVFIYLYVFISIYTIDVFLL